MKATVAPICGSSKVWRLYRINQVVGIKDRKDEFIISLMDRIADLELTEIKGNRQLDVCELVSKLSQESLKNIFKNF